MLVGRLLQNDVQSSLVSDSSSVASYNSSNPCIWCCHSVSEQEDIVPADKGEKRRPSFELDVGRPLVFSFRRGLGAGLRKSLALKSSCLNSSFSSSEYCVSRRSSIIVLSFVPRACRRGGHLACTERDESDILPREQLDGLIIICGSRCKFKNVNRREMKTNV